MTRSLENPPTWRPDQQFLKSHLLVPLAIALVILTLLEHTGIDLWLADRWFAWEGGNWSLRHHWLTYDVIHHHGKQLIITLAAGFACLLMISWRIPRHRVWRWPLAYTLVCMALLPASVAFLKKFNTVACPWDLARFGGELAYLHNFQSELTRYSSGHCFPSGHASGGFALVALYFAVLAHRRNAWMFLLPGVLIGTVFALGQQARGAHFLSHDLWSFTICWFGSLLLFFMIRPYRGGTVQK